MLVLCRPVPVLAEASVIAAGVAGLPAGHVLAITTLANIGVAATYASLGSSAETGSGLLAALAASIGLPLVAMLTAKTVRRATRAR
jgi:3-dehydroquinate synthase